MKVRLGGMTHEQQLAQLNILYEARGNRLKELQSELDIRSAESAKQARILQHQLSLAEGKLLLYKFLVFMSYRIT